MIILKNGKAASRKGKIHTAMTLREARAAKFCEIRIWKSDDALLHSTVSLR